MRSRSARSSNGVGDDRRARLPGTVRSREPAPGGGGSLLVAVRGEGCWWQSLSGPGDWQPLHVSERDRPRVGPRAALGRKGPHEYRRNRPARRALGITAAPVPLDSQAKYAVLAAGAGDVLLRLISPKAAALQGKNLGSGGRVAGDHRSGRPDHGSRRQALDFSHGRRSRRTAASWPPTARCTNHCSRACGRLVRSRSRASCRGGSKRRRFATTARRHDGGWFGCLLLRYNNDSIAES